MKVTPTAEMPASHSKKVALLAHDVPPRPCFQALLEGYREDGEH
jgi:hypothetical protein